VPPFFASALSFTLLPLYLRGKSPRYPPYNGLGREADSMDAVEQRKITCPHQKSKPQLIGRKVRRLVAIPVGLYMKKILKIYDIVDFINLNSLAL
jgi:hypothetical protein